MALNLGKFIIPGVFIQATQQVFILKKMQQKKLVFIIQIINIQQIMIIFTG